MGMENLAARLDRLEQQFSVLMETLSASPILGQNNFVGFTAVHDLEDHKSYSSGTKVTYSSVKTNFGDCYDGTSTFTCCFTGYYYFSFNAVQAESTSMLASLKVNDVTMATMNAISGDGNAASGSAVVFCSQGQQVWVETDVSSVVHNGPYNTFSGILLQISTA